MKKSSKTIKIDKDTLLNTSAVEMNISVLRRIQAWKDRQVIHMPAILESASFEAMPEADEGSPLNCWEINLQLPSSFNVNDREQICSTSLVDKEIKLRKASLHDSLAELRSLLQKQWWLVNRKKRDALGLGQKSAAQFNTAICSIIDRQDKHVQRYRRSRNALLSLSPDGQWKKTFRELQDSEIRMLEDKGLQRPSWIWTMKTATPISKEEFYSGTYYDVKIFYK